VGSRYYDARGAEVAFDPSSCRSADTNIETCLHRQGITGLSATFHPDSQFWSLHYIETATYTTVAGIVLLTGAWALRRRPLWASLILRTFADERGGGPGRRHGGPRTERLCRSDLPVELGRVRAILR